MNIRRFPQSNSHQYNLPCAICPRYTSPIRLLPQSHELYPRRLITPCDICQLICFLIRHLPFFCLKFCSPAKVTSLLSNDFDFEATCGLLWNVLFMEQSDWEIELRNRSATVLQENVGYHVHSPVWFLEILAVLKKELLAQIHAGRVALEQRTTWLKSALLSSWMLTIARSWNSFPE